MDHRCIQPTTRTQHPQWRNNAAALLEEPRLQAIFDQEFAAGHEAMAYPWYYTQVRLRLCAFLVVFGLVVVPFRPGGRDHHLLPSNTNKRTSHRTPKTYSPSTRTRRGT